VGVRPRRTQDQKKRSARARGQLANQSQDAAGFAIVALNAVIVRAELHVEEGADDPASDSSLCFLPSCFPDAFGIRHE